MQKSDALFERDKYGYPCLAADPPGNMTPSGHIFGEHDVTRPELPLRAVADLDLALAAQGDDVLAAGGIMESLVDTAPGLPEQDTGSRNHTRPKLAFIIGIELDIDVFEMRLTVRSREQSCGFQFPLFPPRITLPFYP
jgi:hypothetical protein